MSGRNEVTPAPLQPHGLPSFMNPQMPLHPNPPRFAEVRQNEMGAIERNLMTAYMNQGTPGTGPPTGPRTQPQTPETNNSFMRFLETDNVRLAWPSFSDMVNGRVGDRDGNVPEADPEPEHDAHGANAQAALAEDDEDEALRGAELAAAEAEVGGRFDIDLQAAREVVVSLQGAIMTSWEGLEDAASERLQRQKHLARAKKHRSRLCELGPLVHDSERASLHLADARAALEGLEHVASTALEDVEADLRQWKRHVRVLQGLLTPLGAEPGAQHKPLCPVCMMRPVSRVLLPCGHTLCQQCAERRQNTRSACYTCRRSVVESRLFYI